jgi:hypothetical protein
MFSLSFNKDSNMFVYNILYSPFVNLSHMLVTLKAFLMWLYQIIFSYSLNGDNPNINK